MSLRVGDPIDIYGDESCGLSAISYGAVAFPSGWRENVEWRLSETKRAFGARPEDRLHCVELFNEGTRAAGAWKHLSRDKVFELLEHLARELVALRTQQSASVWIRDGKPFGQGGAWLDREGNPVEDPEELPEMGDKAVAIMLAGGTVAALAGTVGNPIRFFPDPDGDSKIQWSPRPRKVTSILEAFWYGIGTAAERVSMEKVLRPKPQMTDVADAVAYVSQKAHMPASETTARFQGILKLMRIDVGYLKRPDEV